MELVKFDFGIIMSLGLNDVSFLKGRYNNSNEKKVFKNGNCWSA